MTTDPSPSSLYALYHSGAYLCLAIVALYLALKFASLHVAWLKVPGRAHFVTGILGAAALVIVPISQGTTPNFVMFTTVLPVLAALFLPGAPKKDATAQAGFVRLGLMVVLAMLGAMLLFGCGASSRLKTLDATMATLDSAEIGLMAFDQKHQNDIVNDCDPKATKADCQAKLDAYRAKRDTAVKALVAAYTALTAAFQVDDDPSAATAIAAAAVVSAQLKGLGL